jgi:hypothetical protein
LECLSQVFHTQGYNLKQTDQVEIKNILLEIFSNQIPISGGGKNKKPSFYLRKPELYWNLGVSLKKAAENSNVPEEQRRDWILKSTRKLEDEILGGKKDENQRTCVLAYNYVYELEDKDHFMFVADMAGHKFKQFRRKWLDYIYRIFSKKNPTLPDAKRKQLSKKLLEKKYTHEQYNQILKEFRGKSKVSWSELEDAFLQLNTEVEESLESDEEKRRLFRESMTPQLIEQLRYLLQLLKIEDENTYNKIYNDNKSKFSKKIKTDLPSANTLVENLKNCIKDPELRKKLLRVMNPYEMGQLQTKLRSLESQENYQQYIETKDTFRNIFK